MSKYVSDEGKAGVDPEEMIYELKSIVIHRGSAYGGHYYAYIRDDLNEGNWNLEKQETYDNKPVEVKKKKFELSNFMTDAQKKELEAEKNKNNPNY